MSEASLFCASTPYRRQGPPRRSTIWFEQACKIQIDILSCGRALHLVMAPTADALSGTEITLDNKGTTNPHLQVDARKSQTGYACWNGQPCGAGSTAWMLPTPIDRELAHTQ